MARTTPPPLNWRWVRAAKAHRCQHAGCVTGRINPGDVYATKATRVGYQYGNSFQSQKLCGRHAMIAMLNGLNIEDPRDLMKLVQVKEEHGDPLPHIPT